MSKEDYAIRVDGVYKDFLLPHERTQSFKSAFMGLLKGRRNRTIERQHALRDISFEVKEGEFFGIVGRNGSGKSTLLKILAEIYQPSKGSVDVKGRLVPFIELGVGFNPELTGRENVYLSASLMGFSKKEIDAMYNDIIDFAELEKFMDQKLKNYSSGMQVRLAFSIATRSKGDILLVDEVLAVGDADFQRKCFSYFRTLKREKKTVVFVSHDMSAVQQYCDRAILINDSNLVMNSSPTLVASEYNKLFVEKPAKKIKKSKIETDKIGPSGEQRWGDQRAVFEDVDAEISDNGENLVITARVKANEDIDAPIFGFSVKNQLLEQLIGTNTVRKNLHIPPMLKDEKREIKWLVPNIFNSGEHYVDCTIAHDDAVSVSDRWPEVVTFQVFRDESNPYKIYSPNINFEEKPLGGKK